MSFSTDTQASLIAILPELLMTVLALAVLAADVLWSEDRRRDLGYVAGFGLLAVAAVAFVLGGPTGGLEDQLLLGGMIRHDDLAQIFRVMVIVAGGLSCLLSMGVLGLRARGDYYAILIASVIGASLMSAAADLIMVFLALEMTSITLYMLAGYLRDERSTEAGLKYFLFGAFTSAISLYGLSLLYGFTGQTNIYEIGQTLAMGGFNTPPVVVALGLVVVGLGFKISAVPFHFWTPDVYEGAPTPVTALLSTASKAASFGLLVRLLLAVFPPADLVGAVEGVKDFSGFWVQLLAVLSVVTMTLGNVLALVQTNIKRLLAYSSIAHAGYILIGVAAISTDRTGDGVASVAFYVFMYVLTNILAFGVVVLFANATGSEQIRDLAGLSRRNPWLALAMTLALLSLAGIPPAAGFVGKFFLFRAAVNSDLVWLALIGVLNAIISLYYYLVVVKVMYMDRSADEDRPIPVATPYSWALGLSAAGVLLFGTIGITPLIDWATDAAHALYLLF
ncbi:NADH-quinone oxidoreductase subunit N [Aggregatilinea lenta]|uniref:NADH-quinone oxidoreductase subunit N n=1 Tax=Aggregatilinea lenta TaxID=913108 RepID=UPI000E5A95BB|nr:NADH-quinone oxidoreductase subunit N [Aggregatilinea lenta]